MKLGVLVSGNLGFALIQHLHKNHHIEFVMTDKKSINTINFCQEEKIKYFAGNPRNISAFNFYSTKSIDVLISINYLFLIKKELINLPKILAFNIHGSLLPKYRGRTPHVWAIINNESQTGITAHLIDEGCDTGNIMEQIKVPIDSNDTGNDILIKFNKLYFQIVENVLLSIKNKSFSFIKQNEENATYFGKRNPDDGLINWNWQKERIRNWVRAQASPYPGAFTFYKNEKIIIDEIEYVEFGYNFDLENGAILSVKPLLVKTPNGVIQLVKIRENKIQFKKLDVLKTY